MANNEFEIYYQKVMLGESYNDEQILSVASPNGWTICHCLVELGRIIPPKSLWRLATNTGWTVAHQMAKGGYRFDERSDSLDLKMATHKPFQLIKRSTSKDIQESVGWTVAHEAAAAGQVFTDHEILHLKDSTGFSVAHVMSTKGHIFDECPGCDVDAEGAGVEDVYGDEPELIS